MSMYIYMCVYIYTFIYIQIYERVEATSKAKQWYVCASTLCSQIHMCIDIYEYT